MKFRTFLLWLLVVSTVITLATDYRAYQRGRRSGYRQAVVTQSLFLQCYANHPSALWGDLGRWYREGHVGICDAMQDEASFEWFIDHHVPTLHFNARVPDSFHQLPY
jgi:hypothetical protein